MTDLIGLHGQYALVPPQTFVHRLAHEWTTTYHNIPSAALKALWTTMANTYQAAILDTAAGVSPRWRILWPPTGSGKTLGAKVYAALQAEMNATTALSTPVGILIVTRLISQADEMVAAINALAGRQVAVADHSEHRATYEQLHASDVVVITHQAYVNATQTLTSTRAGQWDRLTNWKGGKRLLTIIDEALCNAIEESQVKVDRLGQAIGFIPHGLRSSFTAEVAALEQLYVALGHHAGVSAGFGGGACMAWGTEGAPISPVNLAALRAEMLKLPYDHYLGKIDVKERNRIATQTDKTLGAAAAVLDQYAYFALRGTEPTLNSSALLVPLDAPGPVVLDATAREDFIYKLMEDRADIIPTPPGVRNYASVTLHVARTSSGTGKAAMVENAKTRFPRLIEDLTQRLTPDRSVLFCVHKAVEHELPESGDMPFAKVAKAHWGAVDGSNAYADCNVAVIFGLPFRDAVTWPTNVFFALKGVQGDDWLDNPTWKGQTNLREHMVRRQLSASIIQAINRICCRHVTDDRGGCPPADVFIVLPSGERGEDILASIRKEMPGIQVTDWPFEPDGPKVHRRGADSARCRPRFRNDLAHRSDLMSPAI
ncbi:hypothetical protein, partial [Bradyrhizobium jicamae]|uniref:hypothetical protein n=1 Tax=Bradyrhizobium jicamae TaxID=280332 RepID=UPI00201399A8